MHLLLQFTASFLASAVEMVEALTIVLAVGITRGWRAALQSDGTCLLDSAFGRIRQQDLPYWADPGRRQAGVINTRDGGRGVYFEDPDGHLLELLTRPYGSGA